MKIGFTSLVGDLFHAGHVSMIKECLMHCDYLVVCVMADVKDREGKATPAQSLFERMIQISNCKGVSECYACSNEKDLLLAIKTIKPDIRFVGEDYKGKDFTGKEYCERVGIEIFYNHREHKLSSTELKSRIINERSSMGDSKL